MHTNIAAYEIEAVFSSGRIYISSRTLHRNCGKVYLPMISPHTEPNSEGKEPNDK
jgi:hypothetical protein